VTDFWVFFWRVHLCL